MSYKFYAVKSGRVPGIYTDWPSAQKQVIGWPKPKHKCFSTKAEAQRFLDEDDGKVSDHGTLHQQGEGNVIVSEADTSEPVTKKFKNSPSLATLPSNPSRSTADEFDYDFGGYEPGIELPSGVEDGFDPNIFLEPHSSNVIFKTRTQRQATKLQATSPSSNHVLRIYTDGSSLRNGQKGAFAGVGVYFGPSDAR